MAPSSMMHPYLIKRQKRDHTMPQKSKAMTIADIDCVIESFVEAALNAKKIGFDGIELHGAHGYLIDQFFWSVTNQRTDEYGGASLKQRTKFATELIKAVRHAVGSNFPLCLRISQWKLGDYSYKLANNPHELAEFLEPLADAGVDLFHCSTRRLDDAEFNDSPLCFSGWVKKLSGMPTIAVGSFGLNNTFTDSVKNEAGQTNSIDNILKRLHHKEFDLLAIGRGLIADPELPHKLKQQRFNDIITFHPDMLKEL